MRKKLISLLMALAMLLSLVPTSALAFLYDDSEESGNDKTMTVNYVLDGNNNRVLKTDVSGFNNIANYKLSYAKLSASGTSLTWQEGDLKSFSGTTTGFTDTWTVALDAGLYLVRADMMTGASANKARHMFRVLPVGTLDPFLCSDYVSDGSLVKWTPIARGPEMIDGGSVYQPSAELTEVTSANHFDGNNVYRSFDLVITGAGTSIDNAPVYPESIQYQMKTVSGDTALTENAVRNVYYNVASRSDIHVFVDDEEIACADSQYAAAGAQASTKGITWNFVDDPQYTKYENGKMTYRIQFNLPKQLNAANYTIKVNTDATLFTSKWAWGTTPASLTDWATVTDCDHEVVKDGVVEGSQVECFNGEGVHSKFRAGVTLAMLVNPTRLDLKDVDIDAAYGENNLTNKQLSLVSNHEGMDVTYRGTNGLTSNDDVTNTPITDSAEGWTWFPASKVADLSTNSKYSQYGVKYAEEITGKNVLVLDNFWMDYNVGSPVYLPADTVIILADGSVNKVVPATRIAGVKGAAGAAIYGEGDLAILGDTGTLEVVNEYSGDFNGGQGIVAKNVTINANVTVNAEGFAVYANEGDVTINGGDVYAESEGNTAIYGTKNVTVNGGDVTAVATATNAVAIKAASAVAPDGNVTFNGGDVTATGASCGVYAYNDVVFNGGEVYAKGEKTGVKANNGSVRTDTEVTENFASVTSIACAESGKNISGIYAEKVVNASFSNLTVVESSVADNCRGVFAKDGVTLYVKNAATVKGAVGICSSNSNDVVLNGGDYDVTSTKSHGLYAKVGTVVVNADVVLNTPETANGIYAKKSATVTKDGSVTVATECLNGIYAQGGDVEIYGDVYATQTSIAGIKAETGIVTIDGATVDVKATGDNGTGIYADKADVDAVVIKNSADVTAVGKEYGIEAVKGSISVDNAEVKAVGDDCGILAQDGDVKFDAQADVTAIGDEGCGVSGNNVYATATTLVASGTNFGVIAAGNDGVFNVVINSSTVTAYGGMNSADDLKAPVAERNGQLKLLKVSLNPGENDRDGISADNVSITDSQLTAIGDYAGVLARGNAELVNTSDSTKTMYVGGHVYGVVAADNVVVNAKLTAEAYYETVVAPYNNREVAETKVAAGICSKLGNVTVNGGEVDAEAYLKGTWTNQRDYRDAGKVYVCGIYGQHVNLNGGDVEAIADGAVTGSEFVTYGIYAERNISDNDPAGTVTASATDFGVYAGGSIVLDTAGLDVTGCTGIYGTSVTIRDTGDDSKVNAGENGIIASETNVVLAPTNLTVKAGKNGVMAENGGVCTNNGAKNLKVEAGKYGILASFTDMFFANDLTVTAGKCGIRAIKGDATLTNVTVKSDGDYAIEVDGDVLVEAGKTVTVDGTNAFGVKAGGNVVVNGAVDASKTNLAVKADDTVKVASTGKVLGNVFGYNKADVEADGAVKGNVEGNVESVVEANVAGTVGTETAPANVKAGKVEVSGTVYGDATATETDVTVNASGSVGKDVTAAHDVIATGDIGGSVDAVNKAEVKNVTGNVKAGKVEVNGDVGGSVEATATDVTVNASGSVTGSVKAERTAIVEASVGGNVEAKTRIDVAKNGEVSGTASAKKVGVYDNGKVNSDVTATDYVEIYNNGKILGNVTAATGKLEVYDYGTVGTEDNAKAGKANVAVKDLTMAGNAAIVAANVNVTGTATLDGKSSINAKKGTFANNITGSKHYLDDASSYIGYFGGYAFNGDSGKTLEPAKNLTLTARDGKNFFTISGEPTSVVPVNPGYSGGGGGGSVVTTVTTSMPLLKMGSKEADAIKTLQTKLNSLGYNCGAVDGIFGSQTYNAVVAFQKANGLTVDGIVGSQTWGKLGVAGVSYVTTAPSAATSSVTATISSNMPLVKLGSRGDAVKALQTKLNALGYDCGAVDGIFGQKTLAAVKAYQTAKGLGVDGIVGNQTWGALL